MLRGGKKNPPVSGRARQSRLSANKPSAFSYYSRRSEEMLSTGRQVARTESAERTRQAARYWRQRLGFAILLITSFICLLYITTLTTIPKITVAEDATTGSLQDLTVYQAAAQDIMAESVLNQNKITISTTELSAKLLQKFPELADAQVSLPLLNHRVQVRLVPARPLLILATSNGSFAIDANGIALVTGSQLASLSELKLPLVTDESNIEVTLRQQALPSTNVEFIATVINQLQRSNVAISSLVLPAATSELHVRITGEPYFIKFNLANSNARQQAGTYLAVQERLRNQNIVPREYIDVRVNGRAYYK